MTTTAVTYGTGSKIKTTRKPNGGYNAKPCLPNVKGQLGFNGSKSGNGKGC